jgi:hypothetical protein
MPKINVEQGSPVFKYNSIGPNTNTCFGCGNYGSRGLPIYRWMSCVCSTTAPNFTTEIIKDGLSQCKSSTACYNPVIKSTINSKKPNGEYTNDNTYSYNNSQYLRRKCESYDRNLPARTDVTTGKVFGNCAEDASSVCKAEITYKPNNAKFSTQGAVSGGERLLRLKYNTIAGDINANNKDCCRKYTGEATLNINITKKEQICNTRGQKFRQNHTVCA